MERDLGYEKLYKQVYEKIYKQYFPTAGIEGKNLKLPPNYKELLEKGLDKLVIKIPKEAITSRKDLERINVKGKNFTRIFSGTKEGNFYCRLEINPSKLYFGSNIKNLRDPVILRKIINTALNEITSRGYKIDIKKCQLNHLEVNKMIILNHNDLNQKTLDILTDEISKGHFKSNSFLYKKSTKPISFGLGTKIKGVTGYDKTMEVISGILKKSNNKNTDATMKTIREIAKDYAVLFRVEANRGKGSLEKLLTERELNLDYFLDNSEDILDKIFDETILESGLTSSRLEELNIKKVKSLAGVFRRYKRMYERTFIIRFLKDYQCKVWGVEQLYEIVDYIGGEKQLRYFRKKSLEKEYLEIKNMENVKLDNFKCLKNIIENI